MWVVVVGKGSLVTKVVAHATAWHCPMSSGKRMKKKNKSVFIFFEIVGNMFTT